jgi:hypothetical protein
VTEQAAQYAADNRAQQIVAAAGFSGNGIAFLALLSHTLDDGLG